MNAYAPRRQSSRWLDGDCPPEVLAVYDNGGVSRRNGSFDRFTVFYRPDPSELERDGRGVAIHYRGMSEDPFHPQGFGIGDDMPAWQCAGYRSRVSHHAARWSSLPLRVKACVWRDVEAMRGEGGTS